MRITLPGYARLVTPRGRGIVLESCREILENILANETLYDFAARQSDARTFIGRRTVYAVHLGADCGDAVIRRSTRGGALARLKSDLFLPPTRGFRELITSLRLRSMGIPTPEVIAYVAYPVGSVFRRGDVVTREVKGDDLQSILAPSVSEQRRQAVLTAGAKLIASLSRMGAHHPDLNVRNILVPSGDDTLPEAPTAWVLDVDRIRLHVPGDPMVFRANIDRLERSLRKQRQLGNISISDSEVAVIRSQAMEFAK